MTRITLTLETDEHRKTGVFSQHACCCASAAVFPGLLLHTCARIPASQGGAVVASGGGEASVVYLGGIPGLKASYESTDVSQNLQLCSSYHPAFLEISMPETLEPTRISITR